MTAQHQGNELLLTDVDGDTILAEPATYECASVVLITAKQVYDYASVALSPDDARTLAEHLIVLANRADGTE